MVVLCKNFLRCCSRSLKKGEKRLQQRKFEYSVWKWWLYLCVWLRMLKDSLQGEKRKETKALKSKTRVGSQNIGNRGSDACRQVLRRQTCAPIVVSDDIIGRWRKILWILVISDDVCEGDCGGKCQLETVWMRIRRMGLHKDMRRGLGLGQRCWRMWFLEG